MSGSSFIGLGRDAEPHDVNETIARAARDIATGKNALGRFIV